ncbi:MAG: aminotransferase class V-fold PLP-dependent enzyme [Chloroflexi bacterium]|nr:aminotransferase class V-fold PLP-dependent enzyme [Chloroflexota bacterium]
MTQPPNLTFTDIRRLTSAAQNYVYFETSGMAPKPEPVIAEAVRWMNFQNQGPAVGADEQQLLETIKRLIDDRTRVISISHVSRRTGMRFPAVDISRLAHQHGVPVLFDGAQAFGAIPVDVKVLDCDFYTFSGHKYIMAPRPTGLGRAPAAFTSARIGWPGLSPVGLGPILRPTWMTSGI